MTVAAAAPSQGKDAVLEIEVINQARFAQALGNLFGLFVLGLKCIHQIKANEVGHLDLDGHGATVGSAGVAHARFIARPAFWAVNVDDADGGFHGLLDGS
jgi:hypothetical protein